MTRNTVPYLSDGEQLAALFRTIRSGLIGGTLHLRLLLRSPSRRAQIKAASTADLHRLQQGPSDAVTPFTVKAGTPAAFMSTEDGRDIQPLLIEYVADFVNIATGEKFNPHVTMGAGTEACLNAMLPEPFEAFTFSPASA